jgi:hypothetical protein
MVPHPHSYKCKISLTCTIFGDRSINGTPSVTLFLQFPSTVEQYDDLSRHSFDISLIEVLDLGYV